MVELTRQPINTDSLLDKVSSANCGACVLFLGTTRQWTNSPSGMVETEYLEYEGYEEMAVEQMAELESLVKQKWNIHEVAIVHRLGRVDIRHSSVAIAVSAPHRREAFAAGEWLIDELKKQVPIWKREFLVGRSDQWQHPGIPSTCCQPKMARPSDLPNPPA